MNHDPQVPAFPQPEELREARVKLREGDDPVSRGYDMLERFLAVPNHAMFLFTSEDRVIDQYIRDHWAALDGLSGEACDIHVPVLQLQGGEDAYSQLDDIRSIPGLASVKPNDLPALHLWSRSASVTLRLAGYDEEAKLKGILRSIFSTIHAANGPIGQDQVAHISALVGKPNEDRVIQAAIYQEVYMGAKYNISGGQQGNVGDYGHASDFTQIWTAAAKQIDLPALALELDKLRGELAGAASAPEHYVAVSEVSAAETAAKDGDGPKVLQHLKKAGTWVWDIATKIGIGVATAAAKSALGV